MNQYGLKVPTWQLGKTAASIAFVSEAEDILFEESDPLKFTKLKEEIDRVKCGEKVFNEFVDDVQAYVENL